MDNWIPCLGIQGKVTSEGHHATLKYPYLLLPGCSIFVERISFNFLKALRFLCVCMCTCTCVDLHICTQESTNRALLSLVGVARKGSLVEMFVFEIHRKIPFHRFGVTGVLHSKSKFCLEMRPWSRCPWCWHINVNYVETLVNWRSLWEFISRWPLLYAFYFLIEE